MIKYFTSFCSFLFVFSCYSQNTVEFAKFLKVLGRVESNNNDFAVGDNGKSISRYQIQRPAFEDAKQFNKLIKFNYESLTNQVNSQVIVVSYFMRYAPQELKNSDFESLARLWNSGPGWKNKKHLTNHYWNKIKKELNK